MMQALTRISVFAGQFESQPLVFAHLLDAFGSNLNVEHIDVVCRRDPTAPLRHVLTETDAQAVEDALGLQDTCVLIFEAAITPLPEYGTDKLLHLATFNGHRPLANNQ